MQRNVKVGNLKKISLAEQFDLSGTKPRAMFFMEKPFNYTRGDGWKKLYIELATELYRIAPQVIKDLAERQIEFFISNERALWAVGNRMPAENYEPEWWAEIAKDVFIYTKNNTNAKLERIRWLLNACDIKANAVEIVLY